MKIFSLSAFILIITLSTFAYAESIFLKDGSIIEGAITKDTDKSAIIKISYNKTREITRKDILRIIFDSEYKNRKYIHKKDGLIIEGFIVGENFETYTYRTDINSPNEFVIYKNQVNFVSKQKLGDDKDTKLVVLKKQIFDRLLDFKLGPLLTISHSTTIDGAMFLPGFDFQCGFYDRIFELEMSASLGFSIIKENKEVNLFTRINSNFVFGNIFGFGLGFFISWDKQEMYIKYPYMDLFQTGMTIGPVLRIPNLMHISLLMLIPFGSSANLNTNSREYTFNSNFNFNMLFSIDVFVWKNLSVGLTYILQGGEFSWQGGDNTNPPPFTKVLFYSHRISLNVGYGFNL